MISELGGGETREKRAEREREAGRDERKPERGREPAAGSGGARARPVSARESQRG